jgi:uncharacterized membrane protein YfcA
VTSVLGVALYQFIPAQPVIETRPDWLLGILFGIGGLAGMYVEARTQKHVPQHAHELCIIVVLMLLVGKYMIEYKEYNLMVFARLPPHHYIGENSCHLPNNRFPCLPLF